jgi:uncharacterized protein (DUF849 family)/N-acetylglutamate synthase-like GNAT family acetyltransferase
MKKVTSQGSLFGGNIPDGISAEPLIINVCLSGMVDNGNINPYIPYSVNEIIDNALSVIEAGASMLHVHAFDDKGVPTQNPEVFGRIFEGIRKENSDVVLTATTSGRMNPGLEGRSGVLNLDGDMKPDMASLSLSSLNFPKQESINSPDVIQGLCELMYSNGIAPELEAFDLGMVNYAFYLQRKGMLPQQNYINFLLGSLGTIPGRGYDLASLVKEVPNNWVWSAAGIGRYQLSLNAMAIAMGGHVRVGLEDNPYYDYAMRVPAKNEDLVGRLVRISNELGRNISSPIETRKKLVLNTLGNWEATRVKIRKMIISDTDAVMSILSKWNMAPIISNSNILTPERDRIEINNSFVAVLDNEIVGTCGYYILDSAHAETASLAVNPDVVGCGIGYKLHEARLDEMRSKGIKHVRTETDRPNVIHWYINKFGYRITGKSPKKHSFGLDIIDHWTILEKDL